MALRDVLSALNQSNSAENLADSRLAGEGVEQNQFALRAAEDVFDAPMMIMNQIHEA